MSYNFPLLSIINLGQVYPDLDTELCKLCTFSQADILLLLPFQSKKTSDKSHENVRKISKSLK